jgi:glycosyltransferase involved in cell wall biosynthesis
VVILYITDLYPPNGWGGAEVIAQAEARAMARLGHRVVVVTASEAPKTWDDNGVSVREFTPLSMRMGGFAGGAGRAITVLTSLFDPIAYAFIARVIDEVKPDLVHAHSTQLISWGALRAVNAGGVPLVQTFHSYHYECPKGGLLRKWTSGGERVICAGSKPLLCNVWLSLFRALSPRVRTTIAISSYALERMRRLGMPDPVLCLNGLEAPPEALEASDTRQRSNARRQVLFVGRLDPTKGAMVLLRAYLALKNLHGVSELVIVGDGEQLPELRRVAQGVDGVPVRFCGPVPHDAIWEHYQEAYTVVVPSLWYEVLNTVAIESALSGRPAIVSDFPGMRDSVRDGVTGFFFRPGDVEELAEKLRRLLSDPDLARRMGAAARTESEKFTMSAHLSTLLGIYSKAQVRVT